MFIPWKIKSKLFSIIDYFKSSRILFLLQKYITRNSLKKSITFNPYWELHKNNLLNHQANGIIFEFGVGNSLVQNLYLSKSVNKQILYDIEKMIDIDLIKLSQEFLISEKGLNFKSKINNFRDLKINNIYYYAPADASKTNLKSNSIDACLSTDTLEHIPKKNLLEIFSEINRILKVNGIFSIIIDYSDHYAYSDKSIHPLNFLRFSEKEWNEKYNHKSHYQNRIRHSEYKELLIEAGFELIEYEILKEINELPNFKLKVNSNNIDDFSALRGYFLAVKT